MKARRRSTAKPAKQPLDPHVRQVLDAFRRVVRVLRLASRDAEKRVGLSAAQLFVLQKLAEEKALTVNELAHRTHTHQSSVSVVVQRLVDRRFVERDRSAADRRQMVVSATPLGRAALRTAPAAAQEQIIEALETLPPAHLRQLSDSLQHLLGALGIDGDKPALMLFEDDGVPASSRSALAKQATEKDGKKRPPRRRNPKRS